MRFGNLQRSALALMVWAASALSAWAATDTVTFQVTASVLSACDVQATNHAFGTYTPSSGTPLDGTSTVSVYCTSGTPYTLSLDVGTGGGDFTARQMGSGGNQMSYNLYTTNARSTVWGDGSGSTGTISGNGSGLLTAAQHIVYGRIAINQDVAPGSYTSTVTVTVTF
jgi:spore coat protein U-like protein